MQDMRYKKNFKYDFELLWVPLVAFLAFCIFIKLLFLSVEKINEEVIFWWVVAVNGFGILFFGAIIIHHSNNALRNFRQQRMTIYGTFCADVPRCFNLSLGNKEIAKRIMLDAHKRNKKFIEKHFDEWVVLCVRDKLLK